MVRALLALLCASAARVVPGEEVGVCTATSSSPSCIPAAGSSERSGAAYIDDGAIEEDEEGDESDVNMQFQMAVKVTESSVEEETDGEEEKDMNVHLQMGAKVTKPNEKEHEGDHSVHMQMKVQLGANLAKDEQLPEVQNSQTSHGLERPGPEEAKSAPQAPNPRKMNTARQAPQAEASLQEQQASAPLQTNATHAAQEAKLSLAMGKVVGLLGLVGTDRLLVEVWTQAPLLVILAVTGILTVMVTLFMAVSGIVRFLIIQRQMMKKGKDMEVEKAKEGWIKHWGRAFPICDNKLQKEIIDMTYHAKKPRLQQADSDSNKSADTDEEEPEAESESEAGDFMAVLQQAQRAEQANEAADVEYAARTAFLYC